MFRMAEGLFARKSVGLAGAAVFGSLAALLTIITPARIQPSFSPLPFLLFDPAEIFAVLAFLIFGPIPAFIVAIVHWVFLTVTGSGTPLGPFSKFTAVVAALIGLWIGSRVYGLLVPRCQTFWGAIVCLVVFGVFARIAITLFVNYDIFTFIGPVVFGVDYLGFGQKTLQSKLKLRFVGPEGILAAMLVYTSIFNIVQALLAISVPYFIFTPLSATIPEIASGNPWVSNFTKYQV